MLILSRLKSQHWVTARTIHTRSVLAPQVLAEQTSTAQRSASRRDGTAHRARPVAATRAAMARPAQPAQPSGDVFFLDAFALRQWDDSDYSGTRIAWDKADFVKR